MEKKSALINTNSMSKNEILFSMPYKPMVGKILVNTLRLRPTDRHFHPILLIGFVMLEM